MVVIQKGSWLIKILLFAVVLTNLSILANCAEAQTPSYQGIWWDANESGWGINLNHQGDIIFAAWFTYDRNGQAIWWVSSMAQSNSESFSGDLYQMSGPEFSEQPWDPDRVMNIVVGTAEITFSNTSSATFKYTVDDTTQTKDITPYIFRARPYCQITQSPVSLDLATNYSGIWWAADGTESGWGLNLVDQNNSIFVTWFTYDDDEQPWWLSGSLRHSGTDEIYTGHLHPTTGPSFDSQPFDPDEVNSRYAGPARIEFHSGNDADFKYTVDGITQTKKISRYVFRENVSQCSQREGVYGWSFQHERHGENFLPYHYNIVDGPDHPIRWGSESQRFEERSGDCYGTDCTRSDGTRERSELAQNSRQNYEGDEFWYGLSFFATEESANVSSYVNFFQFIQHPAPGEPREWYPSFMFRKMPSGSFIVYSFPTTSEWQLVSDNLIRHQEFFGAWQDIVMHVRWSTNEEGFLKVWVNGNQKIDYRGKTITTIVEPDFTYFKYGIYRPSADERSVTYFDELRRGKSREEVDIRLIEQAQQDSSEFR